VANYTNAAKQTGVQLVSTVRYPVGTKDFSTFLTQVKSAKPDVLLAHRSVPEVQGILAQGTQLGAAKYYMSETMDVDTALNTPGVENTVILLPTFAPTYSKSATLPEDKPEVIFGTGQPPFVPGAAIVTYYAVWLTKQAIEKAGTTDVNKVFEALKGQSYDGPFGRCSISQKLFMECTTIFSIVKGKSITVQRFLTPQDTKEGERESDPPSHRRLR
jgi:urea transport system substrate-binding protein